MNFSLRDLGRVFFCTGARNHDLLALFSEENLSFEFDERMASFKALGLARMSHLPVAICCTSGTAVAECTSALLEAFYSKTPLVLISGDRPAKMHGTGAPQTIHHSHITQNIVGTYIEISLEEFRTLNLQDVTYPLHINVIVDDSRPHEKMTKTSATLEDFKTFLGPLKSPLFIFSHEHRSMREFIIKFAATGLPFYSESLSDGRDLSSIDSEMTLVNLLKKKFFDGVVRVGHTPLSKVWRLLENDHLPVFSFDERNLAALSYGSVAPLSSRDLLADHAFWQMLENLSPYRVENHRERLNQLLEQYPQSEMAVLRKIQDKLPRGSTIYLGNSLVIRFFELVQEKEFNVFGSRGVNGIDGQLATAIGMALGTTEIVTCILGDITTLYDLSSLREMPKNLRLIIINNGGGRIFDMLKLDPRIILEHELKFNKISQGFELTYASQDLNNISTVQVLELLPEQDQTRAFLKEWNT